MSLALAAALLSSPAASAADSPSAANETVAREPSTAETALQMIVDRQQSLFAAAVEDHIDEDNLRRGAQQIARSYDEFLRKNPNYPPGYAAYGVFLGRVDMRRQSAAMLLKANELFGKAAKDGGADTPAFVRTWALVKNQLGNHLAEDGKPLQAVNYYLAAIELTPNEPLYHYQLGTLLTEGRDDFVASGHWTRESLEQAMHEAFRRASELAPERIEFAYRYAESFYDLEKPDWQAALKVWGELEENAPNDLERQTMRLHAANILIKTERMEHARALLTMIDEPTLQTQKQKLMVQLPPEPVQK